MEKNEYQALTEELYQSINKLAVNLLVSYKTMKTEDLLKWINENYGTLFEDEYYCISQVLPACFRRANYIEKWALKNVFLRKDESNCLKDYEMPSYQ